MVADCRAECIACNKTRKLWFCLKCDRNRKNTLVAKYINKVKTSRSVRLIIGDTDRVYNYSRMRMTDRSEGVIPRMEFLSSAMCTFKCTGCGTHLGFRHVINHCPTLNRTVVKNLKKWKLSCFPAGQYCRGGYCVVYNILFEDKLIYKKGPSLVESEEDESERVGGGGTICIKGFGAGYHTAQLEVLLLEHFSTCGEIPRLFISNSAPLRFALMEFSNSESFLEALQLDRTNFHGAELLLTTMVTRL